MYKNHILNSVCIGLLLGLAQSALATDYYVHTTLGKDTNDGMSKVSPIQSLAKASLLLMQPGDRLLLADGQTFIGSLRCLSWQGSADKPILIETVSWQ